MPSFSPRGPFDVVPGCSQGGQHGSHYPKVCGTGGFCYCSARDGPHDRAPECREAEAKRQKWQRIALEACKQCGQNTLPKVALPVPFAEWLRGGIPEGLNIIASLAPGVRPVREVLEAARSRSVRHASLLVGPEGDFTDRETAMALEAGFVPVTLGPIVLRVETAAFFGLAAMRYALD